METIGDRVHASRQGGFIGRAQEVDHFESLLDDPHSSTIVHVVHGPAGIGKSTLLQRYAQVARDRSLPVISVDLLDLPRDAAGLPALANLFAATDEGANAAGGSAPRRLLLLDGVELREPQAADLRDHVLPGLPADTLVVLCGVDPPGPSWTADPGWSRHVDIVTLAPFDAEDARAYLVQRGSVAAALDAGVIERALTFTGGHPLALALVAEVIGRTGSFDPDQARGLIGTLVDQLVRTAPSPTHRDSLYAAATVRTLTEDLLGALLGGHGSAEFDWLSGLPVVTPAPVGIRLDELTRDVLMRDLHWRHPDRARTLAEQALAHLLRGVAAQDPHRARDALSELMYLHPALRSLFFSQSDLDLRVEVATLDDHTAIRALIEEFEGSQSVALADHWLRQRPQAWNVVRDATGRVRGLWFELPLADLSEEDAAVDPAVPAALAAIAATGPLRPGESALHYRFWMADQAYQSPCAELTLMTAHTARTYLTTPGLAVSLTPFADATLWGAAARYADLSPMPAADFSVGGRTYEVYGHDWRVIPPAQWLSRLARRHSGQPESPHGDAQEGTVPVLDHAAFTAAVRSALRSLHRPDRLRTNPLLDARFVRGRVDAQAPRAVHITALQESVAEAAASLKADPRAYRVIHRAYLAPAPSLEAAAAALGMPTSTFRRHLSAAVARIVDHLWTLELAA